MSDSSPLITQRTADDCLRAAIATLLGVPYERLPDPEHGNPDWLGAYNAALADGGWPFMITTVDRRAAADFPRWIAVVPSLVTPGVKHAVVMRHTHVLHDPGRTKRYAVVDPTEVKCGIVVVVTGPGWGPHRDPRWEPKELNY